MWLVVLILAQAHGAGKVVVLYHYPVVSRIFLQELLHERTGGNYLQIFGNSILKGMLHHLISNTKFTHRFRHVSFEVFQGIFFGSFKLEVGSTIRHLRKNIWCCRSSRIFKLFVLIVSLFVLVSLLYVVSVRFHIHHRRQSGSIRLAGGL